MSDEMKIRYESELLREAERIMAEVNADSDVANVTVPVGMYENIFLKIRAQEAKREEARLTFEEKELIHLGKIYKKKRKNRKYVVLAAAIICTMAVGITSIGESEKVFETMNWMLAGRKQINVDSDSESIEKPDDLDEEQAYEEIEEQYGFYPVKLNYLPEGMGFLEAEIDEETQSIYMLYGKNQDVKISYSICPNYRESSWGKDIEDEVIEEYEMEVDDVIFRVKRYHVQKDVDRWLVGFAFENTSYSLLMMDLEQDEVNAIIRNLYFF